MNITRKEQWQILKKASSVNESHAEEKVKQELEDFETLLNLHSTQHYSSTTAQNINYINEAFCFSI